MLTRVPRPPSIGSRRTPQRLIDILLGFGGSLTLIARPTRTSWSKALVRHGADPGAALAGVLAVPAEDIQVREGAGLDPAAKANTAPRVRPSPRSPNPSTEVAEQPINAEPGSPSGDN
jgi:hypothetical protein